MTRVALVHRILARAATSICSPALRGGSRQDRSSRIHGRHRLRPLATAPTPGTPKKDRFEAAFLTAACPARRKSAVGWPWSCSATSVYSCLPNRPLALFDLRACAFRLGAPSSNLADLGRDLWGEVAIAMELFPWGSVTWARTNLLSVYEPLRGIDDLVR